MERFRWGLVGIAVGFGFAWLLLGSTSLGSAEGTDPPAPIPTTPTAGPAATRAVVRRDAPTAHLVRQPAPQPAPETVVAPEFEDPDAVGRPWLTAAEAAMEGGDLAEATRLYTDIVEQVPDATFAPYASYKLAWCAWNAGDHPQARVEMERAASWGATSESGRVIVEEARKDLDRWQADLAGAP